MRTLFFHLSKYFSESGIIGFLCWILLEEFQYFFDKKVAKKHLFFRIVYKEDIIGVEEDIFREFFRICSEYFFIECFK